MWFQSKNNVCIALITNIGSSIFRPTSTRTIFQLTSVNAFSVDIVQWCFWSILGGVIFWLRFARVFSQCSSVVFFDRHQLGAFDQRWPWLFFGWRWLGFLWSISVRFFLADACRWFFWPTSVRIIFWLTLAIGILLTLIETIFVSTLARVCWPTSVMTISFGRCWLRIFLLTPSRVFSINVNWGNILDNVS